MVNYPQTAREPEYGEYGSAAGATIIGSGGLFGRDYNPDLIGIRAVRTFDQMRRSDASVRSSLRVVKSPILASEWYIEPASTSDQDIMVADFIEWAWNGMTRTPIQMLWEALLMLDYGYYTFEKVFTQAKYRPKHDLARERDVVCWQKWAPRHPLTVIEWKFDSAGGVEVMRQNRNPYGWDIVDIPINRLLIFTLDEESGNPEGISLLRSAYKHWYMKDILYKIDAIQKERHGIGIPRAILPPNYTAQDKQLAMELVQNLRTNEKAGLVVPSQNFIIDFLELHGNPVDVLQSAVHHDMMIKANVLAQFLSSGSGGSGSSGGSHGSSAGAAVQEDIFLKAIHYIADIVTGCINKWAIPELVNYNFNVDAYPKMKVRRIGDTSDMRALSVALRNLIEPGALTPDPEFETWLRGVLDFPAPSADALARTVEDRTTKPSATNVAQGTNVTDRVQKVQGPA